MARTTPFFAAVLLICLAGAAAPAFGQTDHPRLRAALHELRDARRGLQTATDTWPAGYKERALASTQDAIKSVQQILSVKDVDAFRGVDRGPDYYKRYANHPHLRAALDDLREARDELRAAKGDVANLKERALNDIDVACGDIVTLLRHSARK